MSGCYRASPSSFVSLEDSFSPCRFSDRTIFIPQRQAGFPHVLTKLFAKVHSCLHQVRSQGWDEGFVGNACRVLGRFTGEASPVAHEGPPRGVSDVVSRICAPLMSSTLSPGCCSLSCSPAPDMQFTIWPSERGEKQMHLFGSDLLSCRSRELTYTLSFSPWEQSWAEKVSLDTELCNLGGRGDTGKVKQFLAFSSMCPVLDFGFLFVCFCFCSNSVLEVLCWNPRLLQSPSCP